MTLVLRYIARSDRGLVRSNNEDSVYAGARLLALADGMGGHAAGEVASRLMIEALRPLDNDEPGGDLLSALGRATAHGNEAIATQVVKQPELEGMGTTLTAILFAGSRIGLCHVGDSRGYLHREGQLTQITRDDTFVQSLVDEGRITAEQAHTHPQRSLIMRALTGQPVEPTLIMREARAGDRYLLCSDGLSDVVSDETLADTLGSIDDPKACADRLIELALRSGGPDNVTVVVADVIDTEFGESTPIVGGAAGDDDAAGYVPNPDTAAGRAAALRPPEAPKRPQTTPAADTDAATGSGWRWPLVIIAILAVLALIATAFFVVRAKVMASTFLTNADGNVEIYSGSPDSILFFTWNSPKERVCVDDPNADQPEISFQDVDSARECLPLKVSALIESNRNAVNTHDIKNASLDVTRDRVRSLQFLPKCAPPPAPKPGEHHPGPTPKDGDSPKDAPTPNTPAPRASTSTTTAPTTTAPTPTDSGGQPTCRGAA